MKHLIYIIGIILCSISPMRAQEAMFADGSVVYTKAMGDSAYAEADYATAAHIYEQLIAEHGVSAAVYYNLGGAYYKMDEIAHSILN